MIRFLKEYSYALGMLLFVFSAWFVLFVYIGSIRSVTCCRIRDGVCHSSVGRTMKSEDGKSLVVSTKMSMHYYNLDINQCKIFPPINPETEEPFQQYH